jgi:hypothetical protein
MPVTNPNTGTRIDAIAERIYRISAPVPLEAIFAVIPVERLRFVPFAHIEADECGSLNEFLAAALVSFQEMADHPPRALEDGEALPLGKHSVTRFDAPHLPPGGRLYIR